MIIEELPPPPYPISKFFNERGSGRDLNELIIIVQYYTKEEAKINGENVSTLLHLNLVLIKVPKVFEPFNWR